MRSRVVANLLLSQDNRATLGGSSKALSFPADRSRFHELRKSAALIVIGGNTARHEPYATTPTPLVVLTHSPTLADLGSVALNPQARIAHGEIDLLLDDLRDSVGPGTSILIEAGPALITRALELHAIDDLYLSRSDLLGDPNAPAYDLANLLHNYQLVEEREASGGSFRRYLLAPTTS